MPRLNKLFICLSMAPALVNAENLEGITFDKMVKQNLDFTGVQVYSAEKAIENGKFDDAADHYINAINKNYSIVAGNIAELIKEDKLSTNSVLKAVNVIAGLASNDPELSMFLGYFYHSTPEHTNKKKAFYWFNNGMRLGVVNAMEMVADYVLKKEADANRVYSDVDALTMYMKVVESTESPDIAMKIAKALYEGIIVKTDYTLSAKYFQKAADGGVAEANYWLGYMSEKGIGVEQNIDKAIDLYKGSLGSSTDSDTYYKLARISLYGYGGTVVDPITGMMYMKKAASMGQLEAKHKLGLMSFYGTDNVKVDIKKAIEYFDDASLGGYKLSTLKLIEVFRNGEGGILPSQPKVRQFEKRLYKR